CPKRCTHQVSRNIDDPMDRKQERGDKRGETITLVGPHSQRENSINKQRDTNDRKHHSWPPEFRPKPKPVAFRMQGALVATRTATKNCKDRFEISKADPAPGRITNESKRVVKNAPPEIR